MSTSPELLAKGLEQVNALTTPQSEDEEEASLVASVEWVHSANLEYARPAVPPNKLRVCASRACLKSEQSGEGAGMCGRCKGVWYCSKTCQKTDWKRAHKSLCARTARLVKGEGFNGQAAVVRLLRKIRLYAAPFACANEATVGEPGFVFLQSPCCLEEFALLESAVDPIRGQRYNRQVVLNYMTVGEFRESVAKDDFELLPCALALDKVVGSQQQEGGGEGGGEGEEGWVALCKFRCGKIEVVKVPWVPAKSVCNALASDYVGKDCIQLNLEDE